MMCDDVGDVDELPSRSTAHDDKGFLSAGDTGDIGGALTFERLCRNKDLIVLHADGVRRNCV
jgi:hypothetical protein